MCHAFVPAALYLEAIKLNKENKTSLDVTLVNYFLRISSVFCGIFFQGFVFSYFLNGISGSSLFTECFLYNYSILRKCWIAQSDGSPLICSLNIVWGSVIGKNNVIDLRIYDPLFTYTSGQFFFFLITNVSAQA